MTYPFPKLTPRFSSSWLSGLSILFSLWATPTLAANQVSLNFSNLNTTINVPVSALESFAQTGQLSGNLAAYAQLAPPGALNNFRMLLQQNFQLTPTLISQFSKTVTGQLLFRSLGEFFQTQDNQNGQSALVVAFTQAAANPKGLTVLDVIKQFPGSTVNINGQMSFRAVKSLGQTLNDRSVIFAEIQKLAQASASTPVSPQSDLSQPGPTPWIKQTLNVDAKSFGVAQPVPVDYYLPQGLKAPAPVIVIAHGFASSRETFAYLAQHLASQGFAVVAPTFPYTDGQWISAFLNNTVTLPSGVDMATSMLRRPRAMTLLLDDLEQKVKTNAAFKLVNPQQVGILGQSLGGYTVLASAGARLNFAEIQQQCNLTNFDKLILSFNLSLLFECQLVNAPKKLNNVDLTNPNLGDPRVKAVIAINPLTSLVFGQQGMSQIKVPAMLIAGSDDIFAPPVPEQIYPFTWLTTPNRYLFVLKGGTHFSFLGDDTSKGGLPVPAEMIGPNPTLARPSLKAISTAFFRGYLANQPQYLSYLNQSYLQPLVPQPFGVSFINSLTTEQLQQAISAAATASPKSK